MGALHTCRKTVRSAGGFNGGDVLREVVAERIVYFDALCGLAATCTCFACGVAGRRASGLKFGLIFPHVMSEGANEVNAFYDDAADGTFGPLGATAHGAGRRNGGDFLECVSQFI